MHFGVSKSAMGYIRFGFAQLKTAWKNKPGPEHNQALVRIAIGIVAFVYLLASIYRDNLLSDNEIYTLISVGIFFILAFAILVWLLKDPAICVPRRIFGIVLDNATITIILYFHGVFGAPLFVVYLWVSFGNGFRFGLKYLALSAICGVLGFSIMALTSEQFQSTPYITGSLLVGLVILPLYVAILLHKLQQTLVLAENANRAKSTFLATMSHEIRTPLNGLVGVTDLLLKTKLEKKQKHYAKLIGKSSEWLMRVITDGLDFSKIEAGELLLLQDKFDLPETLIELCSIYRGAHKKENVVFAIDISKELPNYVVGDQLRLTQVLGNLLSNAFKFTEQGYVSIEVQRTKQSENEVFLEFIVEDSGLGIPQEAHERVFKPFKQMQAGSAEKHSGTGLGLAIADRLVMLMGGKLKLESDVGKGSKFMFSLSFPTAEDDSEITDDGRLNFDHFQWHKTPQILVVEDHDINREVISNQLEDIGCYVHHAANGLEALSQVEKNVYDLVLMDCQMPELDGYEATTRIRALEESNPARVRIPIIALTAHVTVDDKQKCLQCGMDDYLGKPFRINELKRVLGHWLAPYLSHKIVGETLQKREVEETDLQRKMLSGGERKLVHDLKNTLFVIQANADMALQNSLNIDDLEENVERIHAAISKAVTIIDSLSDEISQK